MRAALLPSLLLALLGACATAGPPGGMPEPPRTAADLVDPTTNRLDPTKLDTSVSLADIVAKQRKSGLDANDRRFIDAALDQSLRDAPAGPARGWTNPANGHSGEVDLQVWLVDERKNEACGIVNHVSRLGDPAPLKGSVTFCRGPIATWRVDVASFEVPATGAPRGGKQTTQGPTTTIIVVEQPSTGRTAHPPVISSPDPIVVKPGSQPATGSGMQTLGDALEDRSPHVPAQ
jgi:hypothetical protein